MIKRVVKLLLIIQVINLLKIINNFKNQKMEINNKLVELNNKEVIEINGGGFWPAMIVYGAAAGACLAIYEAGKATGEFIYYATHRK